jgi:hypothetical protein
MWLKLIEQVASTVGWTEVRSPSIANDALPSSAHPITLQYEDKPMHTTTSRSQALA